MHIWIVLELLELLLLMNALFVKDEGSYQAGTVWLRCQSLHWVHRGLEVLLHFIDVTIPLSLGIDGFDVDGA